MDKQQLIEFADKGLTRKQIAQELGKSVSCVNNWLIRHGITTNGLRKPKRLCPICESIMDRHATKYCSLKCQQRRQWQVLKEQMTVSGLARAPKTAKRYLREVQGSKCAICGLTHWQNAPILLILDHVDGDASNWKITNLRLLCSNCDATLPTYKKRNVGHGRYVRKLRYQNGQSF